MSHHTIVIIWVMKLFFVQFFYVFLPSLHIHIDNHFMATTHTYTHT